MCHGLGSTPVESRNPRQGGHRDAGFPLLLPGLPPRLYIYGAISTFRRVRSALWPAGFPVYASVVPFPHPPASETAGFMLLTRCLPRLSHGLADTSATLGNDCWLGFIITGLSPDQKRLALLGAQQFYSPTGRNCPLFSDRSENKDKPDREVRSSGKVVHGRDRSLTMMAIQAGKRVPSPADSVESTRARRVGGTTRRTLFFPWRRPSGQQQTGPAAFDDHAALRSNATRTPWMISSRAGIRSGKSSFSAWR